MTKNEVYNPKKVKNATISLSKIFEIIPQYRMNYKIGIEGSISKTSLIQKEKYLIPIF